MIEYLRGLISKSKAGEKYGKCATDPFNPGTSYCTIQILHLF